VIVVDVGIRALAALVERRQHGVEIAAVELPVAVGVSRGGAGDTRAKAQDPKDSSDQRRKTLTASAGVNSRSI